MDERDAAAEHDKQTYKRSNPKSAVENKPFSFTREFIQ
jgi:hypothetical protein